MHTDANKKRIAAIFNMLLEIAEGNFASQIKRSDEDDDIEALAVLINLLAEETFASLSHLRHLHAPQNYRHLTQLVILLDKDFRITAANSRLQDLLGYDLQQCMAAPFASLLSEPSTGTWKSIVENIILKNGNFFVRPLTFLSANNLLVPALCTVSMLPEQSGNPRQIIVTSVHLETAALHDTASFKEENEGSALSEPEPYILRNEADLRIIQEIHEYILQNLEAPLTSLKELAHSFGINEFKLKYGFKQLFQTTVFRFQTAERLKKAHLLIQNTDIPLKAAAKATGFISFPHFSKAFKQHYGYSPSTLKKQSKPPTA